MPGTCPAGLLLPNWPFCLDLFGPTGDGATAHLETGGFIRSQPGVPHPDIQFHFLPSQVIDHGRASTQQEAYQVSRTDTPIYLGSCRACVRESGLESSPKEGTQHICLQEGKGVGPGQLRQEC